jgi:hypothetical protein
MPTANPHMGHPGMHMASSNPHMHAAAPHSTNMPISYPGAPPQPRQGGGGWPVPGFGPGGPKVSKQIVILAVVGIVCVTIFITGIVLFATTRF